MTLNIERTTTLNGAQRKLMKRKRKIKLAIKPNCMNCIMKFSYPRAREYGRIALSTFEPSRGGIGIRLNIASSILMNTT